MLFNLIFYTGEKYYLLVRFVTDASSSNEAVHLQQRLRSLSTELVTLRNRLHVQGQAVSTTASPGQTQAPPPSLTSNPTVNPTGVINPTSVGAPPTYPRHQPLPPPQHVPAGNTVTTGKSRKYG